MKTCKACNVEKPLTEFHKNKARKDGLMGICKSCNSERMKQWSKENYTAEKQRARTIKRHGLTAEQFDAMIVAQDGHCATCPTVPAIFYIDHDHTCCDKMFSCGKCVRGLLCHNCNSAIGLVKENKETLVKMIDYLGGMVNG